MLALTVAEIAEACGARIAGVERDVVVRDVVTDSRRASPGSLFVALEGEHADGHDHVADALRSGAVAAIVSKDVPAHATLQVADTLRALGDVASAVRARLSARVIAITGSSGKTCTKDLIAASCASELRTVSSVASYNNEIGVPLTICAARDDTEALVVEVGSRGVGHIAALMPIVRPDVSVLTNVGLAHAGMFGSIQGTVQAKGELVEALESDGVAVLNADDPNVRGMAARTRGRVVSYGTGDGADVRASDVVLGEHARASFTLHLGGRDGRVTLTMPGEHMVHNALAAAAAADAVGVSFDGIVDGLSRASGSAWRMEIVDGPRGMTIVNDAYNANPDSVAAALRALRAMAAERPTWAVLGYMAELGDAEVSEHDRIGRLAVRLGVGHLVTVGEAAMALHEAARLEGMPPDEAFLAADVDEAVEIVRARAEEGSVVLVKASRAAGLERVVESLREEASA